MEDKVLDNLAPFLKSIVSKKVEDVRILIKNFKNKIEDNLEDGSAIPEFSTRDFLDL